MEKKLKIALIGNPNSGKSSLFNVLTGMRQRVGNYPGVTVDKKVGQFALNSGQEVDLVDFPGLYSMYPNSSDERIVIQILTNPNDENMPDYIICVADINSVDRIKNRTRVQMWFSERLMIPPQKPMNLAGAKTLHTEVKD